MTVPTVSLFQDLEPSLDGDFQLMVVGPRGVLYAFVSRDQAHGKWQYWGASEGANDLTPGDREIWNTWGYDRAVYKWLEDNA